MAKPLFQDIVPPDKKSIKKIPIPERGRPSSVPTQIPPQPRIQSEPIRRPEPMPRVRSMGETISRPIPRTEPVQRSAPTTTQTPTPAPVRRAYDAYEEHETLPRGAKRKGRKITVVITLLALAAIAGGVFAFIPKVSGAKITIIPKGQQVSVDSQFVASKDVTSDLPYQVWLKEKDGKLGVQAAGEENAQVKASGVVRLFNNFSSAPQKLIANTRLESPNGKIFRIAQPVTIPGKDGDTAGSVDVAVTADDVGPDFNVGLTDFTIPGFKGDPKYTKIYGRSKTEINGGFNGVRKKLDPNQIENARQKIRSELQDSLIREMQQNIPENFVFPSGAYFVEFESLPSTEANGSVMVGERATFHGIMFKKEDLAKAIAKKAGGAATSLNDIFGTSNLAFSVHVASTTKVWESDTFNFNLMGTTTLLAGIDTNKLKDELAGKPRKSLSAVLEGYPGIAKAEVIMRPFWKQDFAMNRSEISIDISPKPVSP